MRQYIFLFGLSLLAGSCHEKKEKILPRYQSLTESVYATGIVYPRNAYKVFALTDGYITNLLVDEGEIIKKDQVLLVPESDQQRIRLSNAGANYYTARLNSASNSPVLEEMLASLQSSKSRMENDSVNFIPYRNLLENDATSKSEFDRVALAYQTSRNDLRALQNRYRKTEIQLRNELQNARSQYRLNAEDQSSYRIKSRIDGRVYEFYKEEGELVRRGEQVALIGNPKDLYLQFNIDELDIDKVKIGQVVLVKLNGYPDQIFHDSLEKISVVVKRK
jgi:multidrug resistance efflux pump